jgi:hypothetical protein
MADRYDYTTAGFDEFLHRLADTEETEYMDDVASQKLSQVPAANLTGNIKEDNFTTNLTYISGLYVVTSDSVADGLSAYLLSNLTDSINPDRIMVAICECTAYQDTYGGAYALPYGASVSAGHTVFTSYDYSRNINAAPKPGKSLSYIYWIKNDTGSSHNYIFYLRWRVVGKTLITET